MTSTGASADPLAPFSAPTRAWFEGAFDAPTQAQAGAWEAIASGEHALVVAPTGSGKTLAAFLAAIDRLLTEPPPEDPQRRCRVLYVSPLKALAADVERNLRSPLVGITAAATAQGVPVADVRVGVRTGDTPPNERRTFATKPPDVLITTPESLFLVLTSAARAGLAGVETVIVDEIHALAGSKRGAHLALSLERLDDLLDRPAQRVGLSATVRPVETVASFLSGARPLSDGGRTTRVVQPPSSKELRIDVVVPVPDLADIPSAPAPGRDGSGGPDLSGAAAGPLVSDEPPSGSIWPHVTERVVDLITSHRSTIVFTNSRRSAERLTARINEVQAARLAEAAGEGESTTETVEPLDPGSTWPAQVTAQSGAGMPVPAEAVIARAHHGSMSREQRTSIESALKAGTLRAVVATSSLELGIDMGAVDLVVQVGSPPSVASALQRIGRAGHQVGAVSHGVVLPTHRGDLLAAATSSVRAREGHIESITVPANPLDVLAQQVVAMVATQEWEVPALLRLVRRASPFAQVSDAVVHAVLDMLAGRYPSEDFAELRPRIVWDRVADVVSGRPGALRLAATSGGTIPDRGLYGVYVVGGDGAAASGNRRVGELDEEMVYESRVGDTFTLGSSTWRIEDITPDRVLVSPAPGLPGRLPFWKGDAPARPAELGAAMGAMMREVEQARFAPEALDGWGLDDWARDNLLTYMREQEETAGRLATDKVLVVERFRDELGDWRVVIHSPYGAAVHAPWSLVLGARLRDRYGMDVAAMHSDDGIVLRLPDTESAWGLDTAWQAENDEEGRQDAPGAGDLGADDLLLDPETLRGEVVAALSGSAHFAARFREAAARSLLLPRRRPDRRQPLWQQRQRAAQLLSVASSYPEFPVVLEAVRECLQDDFDVPALERLMSDVRARRVRVVEVTTPSPSPFAQSLLFSYVAQFLYEGDAPLAERRAAALTLDPTLLSDLLGEGLTDVADLLDVGALASVEAEVGLRTEGIRAKDAEGVLDLVRLLGPVPTAELAARAVDPEAVEGWLIDLASARRVIPVRVAGEQQWAVVEDAGRLRDALGVALPVGLPEALLEPVPDALTDLVRRHARTHGPFRAGEVAARFGLGVGAVLPVLTGLADRGLLASGTLRPADAHTPESAALPGPDFCDADVLRRIRRRSLAALRAEVEAVPPAALGVFLPRWHHVGRLRGVDGVLAAVDALAGTPVAASALESLILPARVRDYRPDMLDELTGAGEVVWVGAGSGPGSDGWVTLLPADAVADLAPDLGELTLTEVHEAVLDALGPGGGRFARDVVEHVRSTWQGDLAPSGSDVVAALWELVWAGWVTNDTLAPLRARLGVAPRPGTRVPRRPRARSLRTTALRTAALGGGTTTVTATPPEAVGRWSLVGARADDGRRRTARALSLLDRDGVVVRGTVPETLAGGFSTVYTVLSRAEENGQVRRGYFVEGLGAAQFALPDAVEALRSDARDVATAPAMLLAATDPANPYGAALPWPEPVGVVEERSGHRPGRKVGASVVLVAGEPVLYLERGAKTLLSFTAEPGLLALAAEELARHARAGALGRFTVSRADGGSALAYASPLTDALTGAGFIATPRGLRLRS
ncbi:MAG TPA: DEAD/DEAH box helicase [Actinotalea caeni]|uniref:DEAD/DEAH box helicase n=1 Tax=Actinotalea caeni TaxID=1348467 RepID=UPI002B4B3DF3|nr:DEAD/DEAH box helicase [Actinotalea caeni]HLV54150.1 DEAD/DEAH box helicase [Actinotalea caeni]